jgi:hypothetical protein
MAASMDMLATFTEAACLFTSVGKNRFRGTESGSKPSESTLYDESRFPYDHHDLSMNVLSLENLPPTMNSIWQLDFQ